MVRQNHQSMIFETARTQKGRGRLEDEGNGTLYNSTSSGKIKLSS
jgi:hypothetical protein